MLTLHDYWRSGASWRVRIALNLKGIAYEAAAHDLRLGEQTTPEYLRLNPQGLVPALESGQTVLTQSPAILEWLEERYPEPPLLPSDPEGRAIVRSQVALVCCDIHPLNNLRVLVSLRRDLGASEEQVAAWIARWIAAGFAALETSVERHGGLFCYGDSPTLADCCVVPQAYAARRFGVPLDAFPGIVAIADRCATLPSFARAHPDAQPGADAAATA